MKIDRSEMRRRVGVEAKALEAWIEAGWIRPESAVFSEMDVARAELIRDLAGPIGVNEHGIDVILDLLDQIHGLRHALKGVTSAIAVQHISIREQIRSDAGKIAWLEPGDRPASTRSDDGTGS